MLIEEGFRSFKIETDGKTFQTPLFVPAISSTKSNWNVVSYARLIKEMGYPAFLFSAYDYFHLQETDRIKFGEIVSDNDKTIFYLDNGNYEATWLKDKSWSVDQLGAVLDELTPDFCFSFDVFWSNGNLELNGKKTITAIAKTASYQKLGTTIALIHSIPDSFPQLTRQVVTGINPEIIAVPERELGSSVLERAETIKKIRDMLNSIKPKIPLHILGAGNPSSILIYALCGADSFDALDWNSSCIDPKTGKAYSFSQKDFIECNCKACQLQNISYDSQVMAHNLLFYQTFLNDVRDSFNQKKVKEILLRYIPDKLIPIIERVAAIC